MQDAPFPFMRAAICGLFAMLVGVGIARFGYAPLIPALTKAHWFSPSTAFWLGTANLAGYLLGAWAMRSWHLHIRTRPAVAILVGITAIALAACGWDGGAAYIAFWRLLSGITGGALMVLMASAVIAQAPHGKRGLAGGITFAGPGVGIVVCGLVIPRLVQIGVPAAWIGLGGFGLLVTLGVALFMPGVLVEPPRPAHEQVGRSGFSPPVALLLTGYGLCAFAFVPHMLFMASFIALRLHRGIAAGADVFAVMGFAAAIGPPALGWVADRAGFLATLATCYVVMGLAVAIPLFTGNLIALGISAAFVGAVALGAVMLTSGSLAHLVAPSRLSKTWGLATMAYAVMQALVAAGFSALFHATGSYRLLFAIGAVAALGSAALVAGAIRAARTGAPSPVAHSG